MSKQLILLSALTTCSTLLCASWAEKTLSTMSRAEKVGQLIAARVESTDSAEYLEALSAQYKVGAIIPLQYWKLEEYATLIQNIKTHYPRQIKTPVLICLDAEWGINMHIPEIPAFPKAMTLAATDNPDLIYQIGFAIGTQCKALGIQINIAPVVDVNSDAQNPVIGMRSFGDTKELVTHYAAAYAQGLVDAGIMPCLKHFPGHGHTHTDPHVTLPILASPLDDSDKATLFCPFFDIMDNIACSVMAGHIAYPALETDNVVRPAITSRKLVTEILRPHMPPHSLIISDALNMGALKEYGTPGDIALAALKAGIDILLCPPNIETTIKRIEDALDSGEYTDAELDYHVLKILKLKETLGLHQNDMHIEAPRTYEDLIQYAYDSAATACNNFEAQSLHSSYKIVTLGTPNKMYAPFYDMAFPHTKPLCVYLYPGSYKTHALNQPMIQALEQIAVHNPDSVVLLFGSPYCLRDIPAILPTLVLYEDMPYTHRTAEKIIAGTLVPEGTLPIHIEQFSM